MYGDCQVENPNFNFMATINPFNIFSPIIPKEEMAKSKEELAESGSGSEHIDGASGNDEEERPAKKKRYHRHTIRQIQEMESFFKECPHPDDKQRLRLSQELGLKPRQVKFWFQNRRTQMKALQDRQENGVLRTENESLKTENYRLQTTLRNIACPNCGGPAVLGEMSYDEHHLRIENARLKEELERVCCLVSPYNGRSMLGMGGSFDLMQPHSLDLDMSMYPRNLDEEQTIPLLFLPENSRFSGNALIPEEEKSLAMDLAVSSMNELLKMCSTGEPLWARSPETGRLTLNLKEYERMFAWSGDIKQNAVQFRNEASRETAVVIINSITLVDAFLDANKWTELFPSIISRAKTLQVVHSEVPGHASGSIHLMYGEMQVLSPLVATREVHLLRYCQHSAEEGTWAVVDFPLEGFRNDSPPSFPHYKRRPSGCIIQDMPNGYSRVTWVEHAEVEDGPTNTLFGSLVSTDAAFGAGRWLAVLQRQCERLASLMARNISDLGVIPSPEARKSLMNLAQRMVRTFCLSLSTSYGQSWTSLSDSADDTVRITVRRVSEPGQPTGLILSAVSTTWMPYQHKQLFDFLRDERLRAQLDVLSNGNSLNEVAHIANGSNPGNCISLLRVNVASNSSQSVELVLQESCTDDSGCQVVYATMDVDAIQMAMNGEDPSDIPLLPMGFVIVPMPASSKNESISESGCLLTVCLQVLASTMPSAKLNLSSVTAINHHLGNIVQQINAVLRGSNGGFDESKVEPAPSEKADDS